MDIVEYFLSKLRVSHAHHLYHLGDKWFLSMACNFACSSLTSVSHSWVSREWNKMRNSGNDACFFHQLSQPVECRVSLFCCRIGTMLSKTWCLLPREIERKLNPKKKSDVAIRQATCSQILQIMRRLFYVVQFERSLCFCLNLKVDFLSYFMQVFSSSKI